ncbi:hypothetical protein D3C86_1713470 [compost metagenome]
MGEIFHLHLVAVFISAVSQFAVIYGSEKAKLFGSLMKLLNQCDRGNNDLNLAGSICKQVIANEIKTNVGLACAGHCLDQDRCLARSKQIRNGSACTFLQLCCACLHVSLVPLKLAFRCLYQSVNRNQTGAST